MKSNKYLAAIFAMMAFPSSFGSNDSVSAPALIRDLINNFHAFATDDSEFTIQGHRQSELMQCIDQADIGITTCKPQDGKIDSKYMGLMVQHHKVYLPFNNGGRMNFVFATIPIQPCFAYKDFISMLPRGYLPNPPAVPAPPPLSKNVGSIYSNFKPVLHIPSGFSYFNYHNLAARYKEESFGLPYIISINNNDETKDYCITDFRIHSILEN